MAARSNRRWWWAWGGLSVAIVGLLAAALFTPGAAALPLLAQVRGWLQPGPTTHGHHQIELACEACHGRQPFTSGEVIQESCVGCHGSALKAGDDKHPASKFEDPRNAFRLDKVDAVRCVTCHVEHRPEMTHAMGVTLPNDYCAHCHAGEDEVPPSHKGMAFDTCASAGCHNYHDNRALYEDFLLKHAEEPQQLGRATVRERGLLEWLQSNMRYPMDRYPFEALAASQADAPAGVASQPHVEDWLTSKHAGAGVNCSACHVQGASLPEGASAPDAAGRWEDHPATPAACQSCHAEESDGFRAGLHGMRLAQSLPAMRPDEARLPMREDAGRTDPAHAQLDCNSCHAPHAPDLRRAAVESCQGCHADEHTRAYEGSPHHLAWQKELRGELPAGSGVTCATCHMPRDKVATPDGDRYGVQHNQSATLRPNEKMLRPVCMSCHGLGFGIDALSDPALIANNFRGAPAHHIQSIDMAVEKDRQARAAKEARRAAAALASDSSPEPSSTTERSVP